MRLSAETHHLLEKRLKQAVQPVEVVGSGVISALTFIVVFYCCCFGIRYTDKDTANLVVIIFAGLCTLATTWSVVKYKNHHSSRGWICLAVMMWVGLVLGFMVGDRYWYKHTVSYFNLRDMGSYVNIDPYMDKGQTYMDAGTVYFKEGSYVLRDKAIAFKNGLTYCVAPIVRAPITTADNSQALPTLTGFTAPRSGTVDWWAVGTDCCGQSANTFNCGAVNSPIARSGMRLLDDSARSMYLLAVQEWSASTGLPVRHPLFFEWTKDPIVQEEMVMLQAWDDLWIYLTSYAVAAIFVSFCLHTLLQKMRIH